MHPPHTTHALARWAEALRKEGDIETAEAIERQLQELPTRELEDGEATRLRHALAGARHYDREGNYGAAADNYAAALRIVEGASGRYSEEILEHLNDVARCRFNAGQYVAARDDYSRLLRLVESHYGGDDALAAFPRHQLESCAAAIRTDARTRQLHCYLDRMLRGTLGRRPGQGLTRADRMRAVAQRLAARGRRRAAAWLHDASLELQLRSARDDDDATLLEIQQQAMELSEAGAPGRAGTVLLRLIVLRNRRSDQSDQSQQIRSALDNAATCLDQQGNVRSAQQVRVLAGLMKVPRGDTQP